MPREELQAARVPGEVLEECRGRFDEAVLDASAAKVLEARPTEERVQDVSELVEERHEFGVRHAHLGPVAGLLRSAAPAEAAEHGRTSVLGAAAHLRGDIVGAADGVLHALQRLALARQQV